MLSLGSEDEWHLYKSCARESELKGVEVVSEIALLPSGEITVQETSVMIEEIVVDPIAVEQASQEEWHGATHRVSLGDELAKTNFETLNVAVVTDEFDDETFYENVDTEPYIEEDDEAAISESNEENVQSSMDTTLDAPVDTVDEGNEQKDLTCSRIDRSSYYSEEELRALKVKFINLQDYPNNKDISHIESAIYDSAIVNDEGNPRVGEEVIKTRQLFKMPDDVKFFFQDYVVRHHRPYYVAKLNKDVQYIMMYQISRCGWGVRLHHTSNEIHQWRVSTVKQPHTCGTSKVWHVFSQCTTKYLGWRIVSIVWADSDITVATLIEAINCLTTYRVSYDKARRVKEHALALLLGDWKEAYAKVPRLLHAIAHFNPGTRCDIDTCGQWLPNETCRYYPVLKRVFWCFPQCVAGFTHCRPIISVDGTFLTGKYKGTLMVVVGMTAETQLLPLAFALVKGENNES
jgi:hypothetical protein